MKVLICTMLILTSTCIVRGQHQQEQSFQVLSQLIGGKWLAEGQWSNGSPFKQEMIYEWGLNHTIIKVKTYGTTDHETGAFGLRNEGIRAWDATQNKLLFWEFDVFGGITSGHCLIEGQNIYYEYVYSQNGESNTFRDAWTRIDENTYVYKVGIYKDEQWKAVFLESSFKRVRE